MRTLSLSVALLAATLAPGLAAAEVGAADGCVNYMYVADYHWYYVCVDPRGGLCAVYLKEQHGVTVTKECLVDPPQTAARCVKYAQDLDYAHYVCVDLSDPSCVVSLKRVSGGHSTQTCLPGPREAAETGGVAGCVPTSGGLDYHSYLCVDSGSLKCPVYTLSSSDWGTHKTCYPGLP